MEIGGIIFVIFELRDLFVIIRIKEGGYILIERVKGELREKKGFGW